MKRNNNEIFQLEVRKHAKQKGWRNSSTYRHVRLRRLAQSGVSNPPEQWSLELSVTHSMVSDRTMLI